MDFRAARLLAKNIHGSLHHNFFGYKMSQNRVSSYSGLWYIWYLLVRVLLEHNRAYQYPKETLHKPLGFWFYIQKPSACTSAFWACLGRYPRIWDHCNNGRWPYSHTCTNHVEEKKLSTSHKLSKILPHYRIQSVLMMSNFNPILDHQEDKRGIDQYKSNVQALKFFVVWPSNHQKETTKTSSGIFSVSPSRAACPRQDGGHGLPKAPAGDHEGIVMPQQPP